MHKTQFTSDRTSCRSPLASMRLILPTAAYRLMLTVRDAIPRPRVLPTAEFATIRLRLLKLGARVFETAFSNRPFGVNRIQTFRSRSVDVAREAALLSGIGTKGPSNMGSEDEVEQSRARPCRE
jgi:hypothetical protein